MSNQPPEPAPTFELPPGLLDFEPVPRRIERVDGWTPECQRGFIAALAATGSPRRAAAAVGKSASGVERLREAKGAEGFNATWDAAMAFAGAQGSSRIAAGIGAVAEQAAWAPPRARWSRAGTPADRAAEPPPPEPSGEEQDALILELLEIFVRKYMLKLEQERRCRLEGRIAEADFYVRQITCLEVSLDMVSGDGMKILRDFRCKGHDLLTIAETEMSKLLDAARRDHWEEAGDPPRPDHPPEHLLVDRGGFSTEPLEATWGGRALSHEAQRRQCEDQYARDARAQVEWEALARRDYAERHERDASS